MELELMYRMGRICVHSTQRELSITGMGDASLCFIHYFKTFVIPLVNPSLPSRISIHQVNAVYTSTGIANPLHLNISTYFSHTRYTSAHPHKVGIIYICWWAALGDRNSLHCSKFHTNSALRLP